MVVTVDYISIAMEKGLSRAQSYQLRLEFNDKEMAGAFKEQLCSYLYPEGRPERRVLVLLNPKGGSCQAHKIYKLIVEPMLRAAQIAVEMKRTEYTKHAQLLTYQLDLDKYTGLVVLGGDGLLHEAINGLLTRRDWARVSKLPICIVPAGTGNAVARSVGMLDSVLATYSLIKGNTRQYDAVLYEQDGRRFYGHFAFMWGLVADIDIEGNTMRWMGHKRVFWATLARLIKMQRYHAVIEYLPADGNDSPIAQDSSSDQPTTRYKQLFDDVDERIIRKNSSEYYSIIAVKHAYLDRNFFISRQITLDNTSDAIHTFLASAPGLTRWQIFKTLLSNDGSAINDQPEITQYVRVRAMRISFKEYEESIVDIDGEEKPKLDLYMESIPQAICYTIPPSSSW